MDFYESSSYGRWCENVYGKDLKQTGMVTYEELRLFYNEITLPKNSYILDIGCGLGYLASDIADFYDSNVIGIDTNEKLISKAKSSFDHKNKLHFITMDGNELNFENLSFDLIYLFDTIYFISKSDKLNLFLDKCMNKLKPGGILAIFSSSNPQLGRKNEMLNYNKEIEIWSIRKKVKTKTIDLTESYRSFWPRAYKECIEMKDIFMKEIPNQYEKLLIKSSILSELSMKDDYGEMFRTLNIIFKR